MSFAYRFFICLFSYEIKVFRAKISYFNYFFKNINLLKYLFYLFDKNINPIKSNEFFKFIKSNKKKWKKFEQNIKFDNTKETILVEDFVSHPRYSMGNILIGKYLQLFYKAQFMGLLRKGDIRGEVLFRSFGMNKFYYYKFGGFFRRCKYIYKAIKISGNIKDVKKFFKIRINKIDIGLVSYDSFIRYTYTPTSKIVSFKLILFFAETLYAIDFFEKIFNNPNITKLVQGETAYTPLHTLFQMGLLKKKRIYIRLGNDRMSARIYTNFNQRYQAKWVFSKKFFNEIYKNHKTKSIKLSNRFYNNQIKNKFYGQTWGSLIENHKKNIIASWKESTDENWKSKRTKGLPRKPYKNLKAISKLEFCKMLNWDNQKKIATIFLPFLIDGNWHYGKKNLFFDNYTWVIRTLEIIKNLKHINWIIKEHPMSRRVGTKIDLHSRLKDLEKKYEHIRLFSENYDPASLIKFTNVVITHHSTAGLEYSSFGIPCIVAENAFYTNWRFALKPKNISEYKNLLRRAHKIGKLNKQKIEQAKVLLFIYNILIYNVSSLMPEHIPGFETRMSKIDEDKYWRITNKKLSKFNLNNDLFKKMFDKQLYFNNRHTINFDLCYFKNKILLDH